MQKSRLSHPIRNRPLNSSFFLGNKLLGVQIHTRVVVLGIILYDLPYKVKKIKMIAREIFPSTFYLGADRNRFLRYTVADRATTIRSVSPATEP